MTDARKQPRFVPGIDVESADKEKPSKAISFLHSLVIVGGTYLVSAWSLGWQLGEIEHADHVNRSFGVAIGMVLVVCLFTFTHGFLVGSLGILLFRGSGNFFRHALDTTTTPSEKFGGFLGYGFLILWFGGWFGMPMLFLSVMTGGLTIAWLLFHLALTPPGHRMLAYIEHGSTCLALLLCTIILATGSWTAIALVLAFQIVLLSCMDYRIELAGADVDDTHPSSTQSHKRSHGGTTADYAFRGVLLIACVGLLWISHAWMEQQKASRAKYQAARARLESLGGTLSLGGADIDGKIILKDTAVTDDDLVNLKSFSGSVDSLDLSGTNISDRALNYVADLKHLSYLDLSRTSITDDGLGILPPKENEDRWEIFELDLAQTQVTDDGLRRLQGMKRLRSLNLSNTQVTDNGLAYLREMTKLRELNLSGTKVTGSGLMSLANTSLSKLDLSGTQIDDAGLEHIADLSRVRTNPRISFNLADTQVTQDAVMRFRKEFPYNPVGRISKSPPKTSSRRVESLELRFRKIVTEATPEAVRSFVEQNADKNLTMIKVSGDGTALHLATVRARDRVAAVLLDLGADPNARGANHQTPLHVACRMNRPNIVRLLLKHGADLNAKDSAGFTPRDRAYLFKRSNIIEILDQYEQTKKQ